MKDDSRVILGPCICKGCGHKVWWNGYVWTHQRGIWRTRCNGWARA